MTRDNRITPIEIGCAITKSATTIEELVNQLETFVAYDCPRIYFGIHIQLRELFLQRMNIERYMSILHCISISKMHR
jgi:hypothetical protein